MYVYLVKGTYPCLIWTYRSLSVSYRRLQRSSSWYTSCKGCEFVLNFLVQSNQLLSNLSVLWQWKWKMAQVEKQVRVLKICMFVSFSYVRLSAPLHHVLLITSLSWGPYVSHLSQQHTLDFFVSQQEKDCKALLALLDLQDALWFKKDLDVLKGNPDQERVRVYVRNHCSLQP